MGYVGKFTPILFWDSEIQEILYFTTNHLPNHSPPHTRWLNHLVDSDLGTITTTIWAAMVKKAVCPSWHILSVQELSGCRIVSLGNGYQWMQSILRIPSFCFKWFSDFSLRVWLDSFSPRRWRLLIQNKKWNINSLLAPRPKSCVWVNQAQVQTESKCFKVSYDHI